MDKLTVAIPHDACGLLSAIAQAAGCSKEAYGAICLLSGLAEQCRYRGETGMPFAVALTQMAQVILDENDVVCVKVKMPPEIRSIIDYEIERQGRHGAE